MYERKYYSRNNRNNCNYIRGFDAYLSPASGIPGRIIPDHIRYTGTDQITKSFQLSVLMPHLAPVRQP